MTALRSLGCLAAFFSYWYLGILGLFLTAFVSAGDNGFGIRSGKLRAAGELIAIIAATVGFWFFPFIPQPYPQIFAALYLIVAAVITIQRRDQLVRLWRS